ncbi:MAG: hypothetical protein EOP50_17435 [Sphingobacteriales bacterium]|nr:MAG: hypothetical protein EOP50_17435 [Sphingobacteriales bacterium]
MAVQMYTQDNDDGFLPDQGKVTYSFPAPDGCPTSREVPAWWGELLQPYIKSTQVFVCPSSRKNVPVLDPDPLVIDECPPDGGNGGGGPPPGNPSCPPPPPHVPKPQFYSYAMNVVSDEDIYWSHTQGLGAGRHGFSARDTNISCAITRTPKPISFLAVVNPENTIWLADAESAQSDLERPELFSDTHLDYTGSDERRVSTRHNGQFNALFADGHVKWLPASKPNQWTVQDD